MSNFENSKFNHTNITIKNSLHRGVRLLSKEWSERSRRALSRIGYEIKHATLTRYLSGQLLDFNPKLVNRKKNQTIRYKFSRDVTEVRVESFPLNLFERGRRLRSGRKEPGKYILTRKMVGFARAISKKIFEEEYRNVR